MMMLDRQGRKVNGHVHNTTSNYGYATCLEPIGSCKSEKRAAKLHLTVSAAAINFMDFSNDHGRSFPTFGAVNS